MMATEESQSVSTMASKYLIAFCLLLAGVNSSRYASDVAYDMYQSCLKDLSVSCVKPKALTWINEVAHADVIHITEDLSIVKDPLSPVEEQRGVQDIYDKFEDFISTHRLVATMPAALKESGLLGDIIPRSLLSEDVDVPLVEEGRGKKKYFKKAIIPFLLGLKFKTAVIVPIALATIALITWKAMTLGLLSLVLTGAMVIFKFAKAKVVNYEVVHYPHHHVDHHHVDHAHIEHAPAGWDHAGYGRQLDGEQLAYRAYQP